MRAFSSRESARLIKRHGWRLLHADGSHNIYGRPGSIVRISVPVHGNRPLKIGVYEISREA